MRPTTRYLDRVRLFFVGLWMAVLVSYVPGTATLWLFTLVRVGLVVALLFLFRHQIGELVEGACR